MASVHLLIVAELLRRGALPEKDLYESVRRAVESVGGELTRNEFLKALMTLELRGYVRVEGARRIVQLVKSPAPSG